MRGWRAFAAIVVSSLIGAAGAWAAPLAGDWRGQLEPAPGMTLRLALHFAGTPAGGWTGTLDSLDQGAMGLPLAAVALKDETLDFDVPVAHGHFSGRWDTATKAWTGSWSQGGRELVLSFTAGAPVVGVKVQGLDGVWDGALEAGGGMKLRLAVHIATGAYGTSGAMDSLDQGANGIPLAEIHRDGAHVAFDVPAVHGRFEGTLDPAGGVLTGTWSQGPGALPLVLKRRASGAPEAKLNRPQTPVKPYPYREEEVAFDDPGARVRLAGTLTLPNGPGPFPAVVLIAGSGPNTRDEPIMGHRLFLVLADHLTRHGLAVLRYDKRGVGESSGDYAKATTRDFAQDAGAAVRFLSRRPDIEANRIGLVGHSEGGLIAPLVAAQDQGVAFVVMMAGPGVDGAAILAEQQRLIAKAMNLDDAALARTTADQARVIAIVRDETDPAVAAAKLEAAADDMAVGEGVPEAQVESRVAQIDTDWFRAFFAYDPAPTLARLRIPLLALIGSKDLQVSAAQNLPALRAALAGDPHARVEELPGLNHLFQPAVTGAPSEYGTIETTIDPHALEVITDWILATVG
jgi:dienelactone hydrolase